MKRFLLILGLLSSTALAAVTFDSIVVEDQALIPTVSQGDNSQKAASTAYVDTAVSTATIPDATTVVKGKVKLAGDLAGTADLPTVPGLSSKEPAIAAGTSAQYWRGDKTFQTLDKASVGLGSVDNTSDAAKPVSTATQTALNLKYDASNPSSYVNAAGASAAAPVQSVAGQTGTVILTKSDVGLANVDNTSDVNKPISTATATALSLKAPLASPALTGAPTAPTASASDNSTKIATTAYVDTAVGAATIPDATTLIKGKVKLAGDLAGTADLPTVPGLAGKEPTITAGTASQYYRGDKTFQTLDKTAVGLANVDNTSDVNKPISTATQTALNAKEPSITSGTTLQYWRGDKSFQTLNTLAVPELTNLYYTQSRFDSAFSAKTTANLSELTNLYYTQARFDSAFAAKSTSNLSEGSNLYYTDARAQASVSATAPLVKTVGNFSIPVATSIADGYLSSTDWTTFNSKAPIASPAFTGIPTAPTASSGTNTTQIATTAFVTDATSQPMPSASATSLVTTTSASTTFVTALTTSITIGAASAPILAKCVLDMSSATAVSVGSTRVTINAVAGGAVQESFTVLGTQRLTVPNQYLSASLAAGTYTVTCEFNRISGTGTVTVNQGSLTAVALQGSRAVTGVVTLAGGGTNASNTAVNGGIAYSTASAINLSAAGSTGQFLRSAGAAAPTWTAQTYPASTTINELMYSSASNVVAGLATANTGALVTSSTGVPSITSGATANRVLRTNGTTVSFAQVAAATDISGTLPVANGGTGLTAAFTSGRVPFSNGTTLTSDANLTYDTTNVRLTVGNGGTARVSGVVSTTDAAPNDLAGNFFSRGTTKSAVNIQNENTLFTLDMTNSGGTTVGASIEAESSRGTLAARTQTLSGDALFTLTSHGHTGTAYSTGFSSAIQMFASENVSNTNNGGDIVFSTTPNAASAVVERLRIKSDGRTTLKNSHLQSAQTTAPVATVNANAGTGATCTIANATDVAGQITITTGTLGVGTGSYCDVAFNAAYVTAPICTLTPASATLSTSVYVTRTTTTLSPSFAIAGGISSTYVLNYHCVETQ